MSFNLPLPFGKRTPSSDPFAQIQGEIDRLFDDFGRGFYQNRSGDLVPRIDVTETESAIEVSAELPGLEQKDVQIDFTDDLLTIKGEKKSEKEEKGKDRHITERRYGSFYRAIRLPPGTDPAKIEASIANGVLTVKAPKPAPSVTKKIEIKPAG
jgi:HSP20 family protein